MKKLNVERRFVSKIAAAVLGLIVWVIIINVEDANFSTRVNDIPIQVSGEIVLESNDLVVSNKGELGKASIRARGKRSDIINSMDNIYATADVSRITEPGEYNIKVSYDVSSNAIYITEQKTKSVKVIVEKMQRKEVDIVAVQSGTAEDSGKIVESAPVIRKAEVRGTANDLAKVKYAAVFVDIDGLIVDSETTGSIVAVDEQFKKLTEVLLFGLVDFDFISKARLPEQCPAAAKPLKVGKMAYDTVIVCGSRTLRLTTLERLEAFEKAGGKLIFIGECPDHVDAEKNDIVRPLYERSKISA